jgi:hypothetical protein
MISTSSARLASGFSGRATAPQQRREMVEEDAAQGDAEGVNVVAADHHGDRHAGTAPVAPDQGLRREKDSA